VSGDPDTASEAADEAFARALAQWNRVGAMDSPTGWTYRVALNQLRRRLRRKQQERLLLEELSRGSEMSEPDLSLWLQVIDAVRPLTRRVLINPLPTSIRDLGVDREELGDARLLSA
jgi:predicted RNA polymerase sigma factor